MRIFIVLFLAIVLSACSRDKQFSAEPELVVIYGSYQRDADNSYYYGEDTRGKLYVIERGVFNLSVDKTTSHFVRIAPYNGKWYIQKVLSSSAVS